MRRIAIQSLLHDRGRLAAALLGVVLSSTLAIVQLGVYAGFRVACSAIISHVGGDVWVMSKGTPVFDYGRPLPEGARMILAEHPCVRRVRGVAIAWASTQTETSPPVQAFFVGLEPGGPGEVPWEVERGLPADLEETMRVSVDRFDLGKLHLPENPIGSAITVGEKPGRVAVLTAGIKTFTLAPYVFSGIENVRAIVGMTSAQSQFWVADLKDRSCTANVIRWVEERGHLGARSTDDFRRASEQYWIDSSGVGVILAFGTILGLLVGGAIVAQTLYTITNDHMRELAGLKAMGASGVELGSFVAWQTAFIAVVGGALGLAAAWGLRAVCLQHGMNVVLSREVIASGLGAVLLVCVLSSLFSLKAVVRVDCAKVFR
jgi:putative ABC transport system permease protein